MILPLHKYSWRCAVGTGMVLIITVCCLFSCQNQPAAAPLFTLVENSGITFRNEVTDSKEDNSFLFRNFYNGGGVATGDINNDGLPDVFFTSNQGENKLYLNKGSFLFEDISTNAGLQQDSLWNTGVTMADVNADGWLDIYVCSSGNMRSGRRINKLYINQHNNTFTEEAAQYGLDISGFCTQASFFDYDLDGDLDMFLINNSPIPFSSLNYANMRDLDIAAWQVDENLKGGGNHLYRNDGVPSRIEAKGGFVEVTKEAGLHTGLISFGLGISVSDLNGDGYPDVYVGNDFIEKDYLYINQKNGTFRDELESCIQNISMSSMSTDVADINNDGYPDIFTTDMIPDDDYRLKTTGTFDNIDLYLSKQKAGLYHQYVRNCLQVNNGNGTFSEVANYSGMYGTDWSWGALFFDADNDGLNDLFIGNGIPKDVGDLDFLEFFSNDVYAKMLATGQRTGVDELLKHIPSTPLPNRAFQNKGNLQFKDVGEAWGFSTPTFSNSIAYADLDRDGDLDLLINNENGPAFVYRNHSRESGKNDFITLELKARSPNSFAIGGAIKLYKEGEVLYREVSPVRGFQSSVDYRQVIGLGKSGTVDSVVITWPDRTISTYQGLAINQHHVIRQPENPETPHLEAPSLPAALFTKVPASFERHREDDFIDFYYERNLPLLLSREGPCVAQGDVDGDGLEDIYIGGAAGQPGQLYLQGGRGGFVKKEEPLFVQYQDFEDVAATFFDADGDGDLDLFLGAGGNHVQPGGREIQHRLYKNDGKGGFQLYAPAFGPNNVNISVAVACDYDGDGDADLFVGGRSVPYSYGQTPQSYLYQNDGRGNFRDVTPQALAYVGLVTGAAWADVTGDRKKELIIVGEWMAPKVFAIQKGVLTAVTNTGLEGLQGWWQSVAVADVTGDGRQDVILGNIGENFYLRPGSETAVKLWVRDFDGNGTVDQFLTRRIGGRDMPVFLKREVTDQFPALKKGNLKHSDYAQKSIQDLFGGEVLGGAAVRSFTYASSVVAVNNGKGGFRVEALPVAVQLSSVNAICATDVDGDGGVDLLVGGNRFGFPPQFGRLDASYGHLLLNRGGGRFAVVSNARSGLQLKGEVKAIKTLHTKNNPAFLVIQNDSIPVLYQWNENEKMH